MIFRTRVEKIVLLFPMSGSSCHRGTLGWRLLQWRLHSRTLGGIQVTLGLWPPWPHYSLIAFLLRFVCMHFVEQLLRKVYVFTLDIRQPSLWWYKVELDTMRNYTAVKETDTKRFDSRKTLTLSVSSVEIIYTFPRTHQGVSSRESLRCSN